MLPPYRFITSGAVSSFTLGISLLSWSIALKSFSFVFAISISILRVRNVLFSVCKDTTFLSTSKKVICGFFQERFVVCDNE